MKVDRRAYTALVTPFLEDKKIDFKSLENLINIQIQNNVGLVILGTTGETPTLTGEEKREIITFTLWRAKDKVPVIVGTGEISTEKTIEQTVIAWGFGADAVLITTPPYVKPTDKGVYEHFEEIVNSTNIPIIVYNVPSRTAKNISAPLLKRISGLDMIIGVKEASGDLNQMMDMKSSLPSDFLIFSGDDSLTLPMLSLGADGVISVVSNLFPKEVNELVCYALSGNFENARISHYNLLPITRAAFVETNPIPIKYAMSIKGLIGEKYRRPICELEEKNKELIRKVLLQYE